MRKLLLVLLAMVLVTSVAEAAKKQKPPAPPPTPTQPIAYPWMFIPVIGILYDLNRRVNCLNPPDPAGLGGPGFDGKPVTPATGNVMIPCWQRMQTAGATPKRQ